MKRLRTLKLTDEIYYRMAIVRRGEELVSGGGFGPSHGQVDVLKIEFADEVLHAIETQAMDRLRRVADLPRPTPVPFVEVTMRPKRRRRA